MSCSVVLAFVVVVLALSATAGGDAAAVVANKTTLLPVSCHLVAGDGAAPLSLMDCGLTQLSITEAAAASAFKGKVSWLKCLSAIRSAKAHLHASKNYSHVPGKKLDALREFCLAEQDFSGGCPIQGRSQELI